MKKIGFIGLGNMGGPMASNLVKSGMEVTGFDLMDEAIKIAESNGIKIAKDAPSTTVNADILITMLPASQHVE